MEILFIIGSILKIIGCILLGILCVLLLFLLGVLCSPIRYQLAGQYQKEPEGTFDVTWLFRIIHIYGGVSGEKMTFSCNLFGRCILGTDKKQKKKKKKEQYTTEETMLSARSKEEVPKEETAPEKQSRKKEMVIQEETTKEQHRRVALEEIEQEVQKKENAIAEQKVTEEKRVKEKVEEENVREEKDMGAEKEKNIRENRKPSTTKKKETKTEGLSKEYFLHMEQKKEFLLACVQVVKRILKGVLPKDFQLKATVGTGDPALTGMLLGAIGVLKMKFGTSIQITGIFTELVIKDIFLQVKGRIVIGYLAYALLRFLKTKPVWQTVKVAWKGIR